MNFKIKAYKVRQGVVTLQYDVADISEAVRRAEIEGYRVIATGSRSWLPSLTKRHGFPVALFSQELLALLQAGMSILEAIDTLAKKEQRAQSKEVYANLTRILREGRSLSQAMQELDGVFPQFYIATIRASEHTGDLQYALERYLAYHGQLDAVLKKIVSALIYPALLACVGGLVMIFLLAYVVPRFSKVYEDLGNDLPLLTQLLMGWGRFFDAHSGAIALASTVLAGSLIYIFMQPRVRSAFQKHLWRIPAVGERLKLYQLARLYRTLGMLLRGGIPLVSALEMVSGLLSQPFMQQSLRAARQQISEGLPISESMLANQLTTEVAYRMLRIGERSGNLGEMMERIAKFYDDEMARWVDWFTRLFEPILMIFIGFVIGGIVLLMYLPVFELASSIQ